MKLPMPVRLSLLVLLGLAPFVYFSLAAAEEPTNERSEPPLVHRFLVPGRLGSLAFDPTGEKLVTVGWHKGAMDDWQAGTSQGDIRIWNTSSGKEMAHFGDDVGGLFGVAFSPDGKSIVTVGRVLNTPDKGQARIWDTESQQPIRTLEGHTNWVVSVAWSPDGKLIATGGFDRSTRIWDAATGEQVVALNYSKMLPRSLRFSRDGKTLVAGYESGSVVLWDVESWKERQVFEAKGVLLFSADLSSDGSRVVAAGPERDVKAGIGQGGRIHVWDVASGGEERAIQLKGLVSSIAFTPSGKHFAASAYPVAIIWESATGKEIGELTRGPSTSGDKICFSPNGKLLAVGGLADATVWYVAGLDAEGNALLNQTGPAAANANQPAAVADSVWPEGATVKGRVLDHRGEPVANAEVLLLGNERIFVAGERRTWFAPGQKTKPPSTRTDKSGAFTITRNEGTANRLAVIADDPLLWVISRRRLPDVDNVDIKLPQSGGIAVHCDLPGKADKQPVWIVSQSFPDDALNLDQLRFSSRSSAVANPGEIVFDHLPPGQYAVERMIYTPTGKNTKLMTPADRQLATVEAGQRTSIRFERKVGRPLAGQVRGLENVELSYAYLSISYFGPGQQMTAFDVIPITAEGHFTTDPIPPGNYMADLFAIRASTPHLSSQASDFAGRLFFTVPEQGEIPKVEITATANPPQDLSESDDLRIRVVDEAGKPVSKFQSMVQTAHAGNGPWQDGRDGMVFLGSPRTFRTDVLQVLVRADGYASAITQFAGAECDKLSKGEAKVTLKRGQKVDLQFSLPEGMTWPQATLPEACFDELQDRVQMMRQPGNRRLDPDLDLNMLNLREAGAGRFEFWLADDTPRFHVAIQAPGFLQCFEAGPFTLADVKDGMLQIDAPRPATLDVSFAPGDYPDAAAPFKSATLNVYWRLRGNSILNVASTDGTSLTPKLTLTDLAPGRYMVDIRTQSKEASAPTAPPVPAYRAEINPGSYFDQTTPTLEAGQIERIEFRSTPFDPNAFRGDRTATVRIRAPDGKPAVDRQASVTYFDGHYGAQVVFSGAVPASGEIVLAGITDKMPLASSTRPPYIVSVDGKPLGAFGFAKEPLAQEFEFSLPPGVGDMAPDLDLTRLATGDAMRLSRLRGKVVLVEFWATWCGPCQEPMAKLNALATEQTGWKDRVAIVPISIDAEQARIKSHVDSRGWTALDHCWSGGGSAADFESPAAKKYVVFGVPESVLIGADGRILWRGHPMNRSDGKDLKSRIDDALKEGALK